MKKMIKKINSNHIGKKKAKAKKVIQKNKINKVKKHSIVFGILNKLFIYFILNNFKKVKRNLENNYNNVKKINKEYTSKLLHLGSMLRHYVKYFFLLPILLVKLLTPSFLVGTPNLWTNLKLIFTKKEFKPLRMAMLSWAVFMYIIIQGGIFLFRYSPTAEATSYTWIQTGWTASSTNNATHSSDRNGWTNYWDVYPTNITTTTGTELTLKTVASSTTQTTTADFDKGTTSTASVVSNGVQLSEISGSGPMYVNAGGAASTYAVDSSGDVYSWGDNSVGQLGDNNSPTDIDTPVQVLGVGGSGVLSNISYIGGGVNNSCAVNTDGNVYCWGVNGAGQLGDDTKTNRSVPVQVLGAGASGFLTGVGNIGTGYSSHNCAVKTDGTVFCWGSNAHGQLGINISTSSMGYPAQVVGVGGSGYLTDVSYVGVGNRQTCALKTDGTVFCWGDNFYSQLGNNNSPTDSNTPVQVVGVGGSGTLANISQISVGYFHTCAVDTSDNVFCWGYNSAGQLGDDNNPTDSDTPVQVLGVGGTGNLTNVSQVEAGVYNTCAVNASGNVYCWGDNFTGQLGDNNSPTDSNTPVQVLGVGGVGNLTNISQVSVADFHVCAVDNTSGNAYCWGDNEEGQLGDNNDPTDSDTPVQVVGVGGSGTLDLLINTYESSGTFTSGIIDTVSSTAWNTMTWTTSSVANTTMTIRVRTGQMANMSDATAWSSSCEVDSTGDDISSNSCVTDGHRYIQYQALLTTSDISVTPQLQDVTINYTRYTDTEQTLTSSMFDTENSVTALSEISWTETLPTSDTDIKFQIRTSADGVTWGSWLGPTDGNDYYTDPAGGEAINSAHTDGVDDEWIQYKVFISSSDGGKTPTLSDVSLTYTINEAPQISGSGVTAVQLSNGSVQIIWGAYDVDTGTATTSFQYSLDNGNNWSNVLGHLSVSATTTRLVSSWTTTTVIWTPKSEIDGQYATQFKIKVIEDDGERTNNTVSSTSDSFVLDVDDPDLSTPAIRVVATTTPATIYNFATDNNSMEMAVSLDSGMSGASWIAYTAMTTISLGTDPDTVYAQFRDSFSNTTTIQSAVTPGTPSNLVIRDLSNTDSGDYRLFIAWSTVAEPGPGFDRYDVWSSTDGITYTLLDTIASRSTNYYLHQNLSANDIFYYKISTVDDYGNASPFSSVLSDTADGQGGTDSTPPTISNVVISATTTQGFTVTWDTNEPSNSTVDYSTTPADFSLRSVGVGSMADTSAGLGEHSVVITGLTPNTTYYLRVTSDDPDSNSTSDSNGGDGYVVTTLDGPAISNTSASSIQNTQATITWNTDADAVSSVYYSTSSDLSGATQVSSASEVTEHSLNLTGLSIGTTYYYYVTSGVATDNNGGEYYSFSTTQDTIGPAISGVAVTPILDTVGVVVWTTDENSTSQVELGTTSGSYTSTTPLVTNLNKNHSVKLGGLVADTTYYYKVSSVDGSSNPTTSTEGTFTTLETLSEESAVVAREAVAEAAGEVTGEANAPSGGGGFPYIPTDNIAPVISKLKVSVPSPQTAKIEWTTDEDGDSTVEYGVTNKYGSYYFDFANILKEHSVVLTELSPSTLYNYRVSTADKNGNRVYSANQTFSMVSGFEEIADIQDISESQTPEQKESSENIFRDLIEKTAEIIKKMSRQVSVAVLESGLRTQYSTIDELGKFLPLPLIGGQPVVEVGSSYARVFWTTDKMANSLVAIASGLNYQKNSEYTQVVGNANEQVINHEVLIDELKPNTTYHYQIRSKTPVSDMAKSKDFTFNTKEEQSEITTYKTETISDNEVKFNWVTNVPTDSRITYIPYGSDGGLQGDSERSAYDKAVTTIHEVVIKEFEAGLIYQIEISGKDFGGNTISKTLSSFSTSENDAPPLIIQVQTDTALVPGDKIAVQAIISWNTNELSTSQVFYQKGFGKKDEDEEFLQKTSFDPNYVRRHIMVITNFESGSVYQFQLESIDSSGNATRSKTHTILTPRQQESVFQVIISNLEETFSWVGEIGL